MKQFRTIAGAAFAGILIMSAGAVTAGEVSTTAKARAVATGNMPASYYEAYDVRLSYDARLPAELTYESFGDQVRAECRTAFPDARRTIGYHVRAERRACQQYLMDQAVVAIRSPELSSLHAARRGPDVPQLAETVQLMTTGDG